MESDFLAGLFFIFMSVYPVTYHGNGDGHGGGDIRLKRQHGSDHHIAEYHYQHYERDSGYCPSRSRGINNSLNES